MNPEMESICGIKRAAFRETDFIDLFFKEGGQLFDENQTPFCTDLFRKHLLSASQNGESKAVDLIFHRPDKKTRTVSMTSHRIQGLAGEPTSIITLFQRVPEKTDVIRAMQLMQQEIEKKACDLKAMNTKLETIYNASSESIWVCDGNGIVISINKASEALWGIEASEVVGKHIDDLLKAGLIDQSVTRQVLETGQQVSLIQSAFKSGQQFLLTGTPVFDDAGRISMVIINERDMTQLTILEEELRQVQKEKSRIKDELSQLTLKELKEHEIIAHSKEMQAVLLACRKLAHLNISSILILGESGTGKGLLAKYIHSCNPSLTGPLVKVNCAAIPESLLEAELFGYEPGAFTGAKGKGKIGLFEAAKNGTLFLDEIGELSLSLQAKLLTCLEEREILHIGGLLPIKIHCNIIAATNEDLGLKVAQKRFRQDLYFRLNAFPLIIPPLRNRPEDIMELTLFFLKRYNRMYKLSRNISVMELNRIQSYAFPGNVRELKNCIKRAVVMADKNALEYVVITPGAAVQPTDPRLEKGKAWDAGGFNQQVAAFEKQLLTRALDTCTSTRALAAHLDMTQSQVVRKLKKYGLTRKLKEKKEGCSEF